MVKGHLAKTDVFRKCRRMLALAILVASPLMVNAQASFGIKAGVNASHLVEEKVEGDFSMAINYHAGGFLSLPVNEMFFVMVEALYSIKGARYPATTGDGKSKYVLHYLNIPLLINYRFKNFSVGLGPEIGYLSQAFARSKDFKNDVSGVWDNKLDLGVVADVSTKVSNPLHAGVRYTRGFRGIQKDMYANAFASAQSDLYKNSVFQVYLGFRLFPNEY